jgi:hypothetical protein
VSEKIYFYQNNPCVIIRDISEEFAEIKLSHYFAGNMNLTGQCLGCCVGDNDNKLSCTCDEHSWVIEEVQEEENAIICIVEKRLLNKNPIEHLEIIKLKKQIDKESEQLAKTKVLHDEWRLSLLNNQKKVGSLKSEIASLELSIESAKCMRNQSEDGLKLLQDRYNKIIVAIGLGNAKITMAEYNQLVERNKRLSALEAGGVNDWEWYEESLKDHLKLDNKGE